MPYTLQEKREKLNIKIAELRVILDDQGWDCGDLNYTITRLFHHYININGLRYKTAVVLFGTLVCVGLELYRVVFGKYEDKKRLENGPVSNLDSISLEDVR